MMFKSGIIFLGVVIVVLAVGLAVMKKQAEGRHLQDTASLVELSNRVAAAGAALDELHQDNLALTNDLASTGQKVEAASNDVSEASGRLARVRSNLEIEQVCVTELNRQVQEWQPQNRELGERALVLSNDFGLRNGQLAVLQQQLASSESNIVSLGARLESAMTQKAAWQHRFNDLSEVRSQYYYLAYGFY